MTTTITTPARATTGPLHLLTLFYLAMAGLALYGQSDGLMAWLGVTREVALGVALAVELLAAVLFAFADWRRTRHGEQALAARLLSVSVAAGVAAMNFYGHPVSVGQRLLYTGASLAGYAVWVLHTGARRRDALRAAGRLGAQAPVYGLGEWLRRPRIVWRARLLTTANPGLGVHASLAQAMRELTEQAQHRAIEAALRRKLAKTLDPLSADIAMVSYDLRQVAARLAASVDYDRLTGLLAADIHPDRIGAGTHTRPAPTLSPAAAARLVDADKPQLAKPSRAPRPAAPKPSKVDAATRVRKALADNPTATQKEIARLAQTTDRTVRRVLSAARNDIDAITAPAS